MGIGSRISERRLIDDLTRMGLNESIVRKLSLVYNPIFHLFDVILTLDLCLIFQVRRALLIMHQREEVEYKREHRVIVRKA